MSFMSIPYDASSALVILGLNYDYTQNMPEAEKATLLERCLRNLSNTCKREVKQNIVNNLLNKTYEERVHAIKHLLGAVNFTNFEPA